MVLWALCVALWAPCVAMVPPTSRPAIIIPPLLRLGPTVSPCRLLSLSLFQPSLQQPHLIRQISDLRFQLSLQLLDLSRQISDLRFQLLGKPH